MLRVLSLSLSIVSAVLPVSAQEAREPDTAGAWSPTFTARHGLWDVTCDARGQGEAREERCYVRYIDVYSPRPNFGVVFLFLEIEGGAPKISLGREFETDLEATTLRVLPGWERPEGVCLSGPCEVLGPDALAMAEALAAGGMLEIGFTDMIDRNQLRQWPSDGFAQALEDVTREAVARGL